MKVTKGKLLLAVVFLVTAGGIYYYKTLQDDLPDYVAMSNGRIEAQSVDISARNGGRILTMSAEEGTMVEEGDVLATLDLNHMAAALEGAKAQVRVAVRNMCSGG